MGAGGFAMRHSIWTGLAIVVMTMSGIAAADSNSGVANVAADNNAFALDLFGQISQGNGGNLFFSPLSISSALAMTYNGAEGNTAWQMAKVMHFSQGVDDLNSGIAALGQELATNSVVKGQSVYSLTLANSLWGQSHFKYFPDFLGTL